MKAWFKKKLKQFAEYQQKRADYILLTKLSDRELRDMGLSRGNIKYLVYGDK